MIDVVTKPMWSPGDVIVRRGLFSDGRPWIEIPEIVVRDEDALLASYVPAGAPFRFPPGRWPTPNGLHPWHGRQRWQGHGVLILQRPGDMHAVWALWRGPAREFAGWYINIQEPFRRTVRGYDTQDLELDIRLTPSGKWERKDEDLLEQRVREGRLTIEQAAGARAEASRLIADLEAGRRWWDDSWADWVPDPGWTIREFPRCGGVSVINPRVDG